MNECNTEEKLKLLLKQHKSIYVLYVEKKKKKTTFCRLYLPIIFEILIV